MNKTHDNLHEKSNQNWLLKTRKLYDIPGKQSAIITYGFTESFITKNI
ncbi:Protein of unknown function [Bacillus cytotoxicus]|uniref:Uncharacterized protein n=1 Tax=Bacillus cytotoxicus TaxID=580165 RepID=A0AAX2CDC9_9BACI|nr:Protein of unknown function [Bacillus cytotoxicus]SCN32143.1 Protein of unknown function [Bacillus cytotoxicus]